MPHRGPTSSRSHATPPPQTALSPASQVRRLIPRAEVDCGMFAVDASGVRALLLSKLSAVSEALLSHHVEHCRAVSDALQTRFQDVLVSLQRKPKTIEEVVVLEEYVKAVDGATAPLLLSSKWTTAGWPQRLAHACEDTAHLARQSRVLFADEMQGAQDRFERTVAAFEQYEDAAMVERIARQVTEVTAKLEEAEATARLFNSREALFGRETVTDYEVLARVRKAVEPYANLWVTARDWSAASQTWLTGSFLDIDAELLESEVERLFVSAGKAARYFEASGAGLQAQARIAADVRDAVAAFRPKVPIVVALRNPGMRARHWAALSETMGIHLDPGPEYTLEELLSNDLAPQQEAIDRVSESAAKEYQIESVLDKMEADWADLHLDIAPYRETGTGVLRGVDDILSLLDEQVTMTQGMQFSAFKGPFAERIDAWNARLCMVSEVLEEWLAVQRAWLYLQPILDSPDINKQLPAEGKKFSAVDKSWRQTISSAKSNTLALRYAGPPPPQDSPFLTPACECSTPPVQVQRGLSEYLETKRSRFARLYFLSNDELLAVLSDSKDVLRVQPHLKKVFEAVDAVTLTGQAAGGTLRITALVSPEQETLPLAHEVNPCGKNVEDWLLELEAAMRDAVRDHMQRSIEDYLARPRGDWMQRWPGMCVLNASQLHWTAETEVALRSDGAAGPPACLAKQLAQLEDMVALVRGELSRGARTAIGALTVIDVHARDVMVRLVDEGVSSAADFAWTSQLRYYWRDGNLWAQMVAADRPYGYEYLGNSFRLVITPLTDKCYLTLMGALQMILGGAPAGPAGTGKTETTKDLAKALAMQCIVYNCSDGLDYLAMGKFFKGLAACGAWACFDEFNRINIEVLSVIGQQIATIQLALRAGDAALQFEGSLIAVRPGFGVFITMNPGYAGRSDLPDSLKALFRPVAMMVPDYALIGEIMFFAYGFSHAKACGAKMVTTFKLCSEQLSSQPHYDYGMRAVKTVITAAGNLKRAEPDADEMVLLLRALQDVNLPKFLEVDLPLFAGIMSDLFPGKASASDVRPELDYGKLNTVMKTVIEDHGLQPHPFFITKVIQLYEMIVVRHGLMVVGPTGGGKSSNIKVLSATLSRLKQQGVEGFAYEKVVIYQLNPKSVTMGQMYGEFDGATHEWHDGIMSTMYRAAASSPTPERKWVLFDGPVDAIWIENMNTVLDDNKKLCLNSGEIIKMSEPMTMMFEVEDLAVASPATVSRVGIIYMEPRALGLDALCASWSADTAAALPTFGAATQAQLAGLLDLYLAPAITVVRRHAREFAPTVDSNLTQSLLRLLGCLMEGGGGGGGEGGGGEGATAAAARALEARLEALFIFALIWSVGCTCDGAGRARFGAWLRGEMRANASRWELPAADGVHDYAFDGARGDHGAWVPWMATTGGAYAFDARQQFSEIVVPTTESVRTTFLLDLLAPRGHHVLLCGPTGTGKTVNISQYLMGQSTVRGRRVDEAIVPMMMTLSAQTSANQTQDMVDGKCEKRRKGVFGPPGGKRFVLHVDDLNMPKRETYGAQPPIELLRQWFDQGGWFDRKELVFRRIIDLTMVCSMGPPGGGRQSVTPRFLRHFNVVGCADMSDADKTTIFETILGGFLGGSGFDSSLAPLAPKLVAGAIGVYNALSSTLLPTPAKSHYTFNLRDLAKVFQGLLMSSAKALPSAKHLLRLWVHESTRVFGDRLVCAPDREWFEEQLRSVVTAHFRVSFQEVRGRATSSSPPDGSCRPDLCVVPGDHLLYVDFAAGGGGGGGAGDRPYDEAPPMDALKACVDRFLEDHNAESKKPMPLVMFPDAVEHVTRVARVLRQPRGNALLLGVGGSGRQSMTRLATFIAGFDLFQVSTATAAAAAACRRAAAAAALPTPWLCLLNAGLKMRPTTFLFSDVQIVDQTQLEDLNSILNSGDVPGLYAPEDLEAIATACRADCQRRRIPPTKLNVFAQYLNRVRACVHIVLCMSPIGEAFRDRLRMFPALVNCCTIDWFEKWPAEALKGVATAALDTDTQSRAALGVHAPAIVEMFRVMHQSVETASAEYYDTLRRRVWVTPTSYLELLASFRSLLRQRREAVDKNRRRLQVGLDKLASTQGVVATLREELTELQPQLVVTMHEVEAMMVQMAADREEAEAVRVKVEAEEEKANAKAAATKEIADDAQRDLDEAIPALEAAVQCLNDLKKSDIDELKSLKSPPNGVRLAMEVCCILFDIKPVKVKDPETGKKVDDYWDSAKKQLLADAKAFMDSLVKFDKDNIPDRIIRKVEPYTQDPEFTPAKIEKASKACTAICMWALAMYKYHFVALGVAPKRARLAEAQVELDEVRPAILKLDLKLKVAKYLYHIMALAVQGRLADLQAGYEGAVAKKAELEAKAQRCETQLSNAGRLLGGLGGEGARWTETVAGLEGALERLAGDVLVAAGAVSYLGPFTSAFRARLTATWVEGLRARGVPHTKGTVMERTLSDPMRLSRWRAAGLPADALSTQNGIMMDTARRWPLMVDPQGQANRFVRAMGRDTSLCLNGMDVVKLTDKKFLQILESAVRFGRWALLENVGEELDAALEPLLLQQKFRQGGQDMIRLGDTTVPYNDRFRLFMTTKLPNPDYAPEVQVKVSLLNFTITVGGLEDQLLGTVLGEELPDLASAKEALALSGAAMDAQLFDIESQILRLLSESEGNILDNTALIETLAEAKVKSEEIKAKMAEAVATEAEILQRSEDYRPVAKRASLLYFCLADLAVVDTMYQYSLPWFRQLFVRAIAAAPQGKGGLDGRLRSLIDAFTTSVYVNVCRSLFERHKLLFAFLLAIKILQGEGRIDPAEWRFLISGNAPAPFSEGGGGAVANPDPSWIESNVWAEITAMSGLPFFRECPDSFVVHAAEWRRVFDSSTPQLEAFPAPYKQLPQEATDGDGTQFGGKDVQGWVRRMCLLRCLRRDKVADAMRGFVADMLGAPFVEPPPFDLRACYEDSAPTTPLIFVLSTGSDPNKDLMQLAQDLGCLDRLRSIALGQGQGALAGRMMEAGAAEGHWVLLQNCHLAISWMPELERRCEELDPDKMHPGFRLWLTSMPCKAFPAAVLQGGVKMTKEPPKGLRANLRATYAKMDDAALQRTRAPAAFRKLLFGLCFFHALVTERRRFGPLGWNVPYEFNETDLDISAAQLALYVDQYESVPYQVLRQLTSTVNYGGRITDDKDMRTSDVIIAGLYTPAVLEADYAFSRSGTYRSVEPSADAPLDSYLRYIDALPLSAEPEVFGMHDNANITCAIAETEDMFAVMVAMQPREGGGGGASREEQIAAAAADMEARLPQCHDADAVLARHPTDYRESLNTVLAQEAQRYHTLVGVMRRTLAELQKALRGLVVLSAELEAMAASIYDQQVPGIWQTHAYPSLKPLGPWFADLLARLAFVADWVEHGIPAVFWISGFFFPQGFLTASLQNYARRHGVPVDALSFAFRARREAPAALARPADGVYVHGLFLEGARWDAARGALADPRPKELFSAMPVLHLAPERDRAAPSGGVYRCPVYKVLTRTGTLSTTGHSTNFVFWIEIPADKPDCWRSSLVSETNKQVQFCDQEYYVKAGVACFCALRY
ncbi:dynein heavy chain and region D6 of dynein motor-domain-containing protein [Tribonema minus]|uniref:Dynein heavy chain and region D6 of dynein motor-domain-containing protein n=1 Tax=Tribonema minus TaxID=303371 RepID=A0A836CAS0_9STRA|nr:dynein heavy chain and region D6 of dynein motor-domain-containing protein [Tribonema minus]